MLDVINKHTDDKNKDSLMKYIKNTYVSKLWLRLYEDESWFEYIQR